MADVGMLQDVHVTFHLIFSHTFSVEPFAIVSSLVSVGRDLSSSLLVLRMSFPDLFLDLVLTRSASFSSVTCTHTTRHRDLEYATGTGMTRVTVGWQPEPIGCLLDSMRYLQKYSHLFIKHTNYTQTQPFLHQDLKGHIWCCCKITKIFVTCQLSLQTCLADHASDCKPSIPACMLAFDSVPTEEH